MRTRNICKFLMMGLFVSGIFFSGCKKSNTPIVPIQSFTIGVILPMDQEKGLLRERALRTAIDAINESGGVGYGQRIRLVVKSSGGGNREEMAAKAANDIISSSNNLVGFITSFSSCSKGVVEQVAIPGHYPVISGASTGGFLTGISHYFQRLCPPDAFEANVLTDQALEYGITSVAIAVEEGDIYSSDLAATFQQAFGTGASTKVFFSAGDPDYLAKLDQLLAGNPDAILLSMLNPGVYNEFITRLSEVNNRNGLINTTFILCDAFYTETVFDAPVGIMVGEVNGHPKNFGAMPAADTTTAPYRYFRTALMNRYQQEVASYNAQFFDIGYIYAMAIEKTLLEMGTGNMAAFRERSAFWIRQVSHGNPGDTPVMPSLGWNSIKHACMNGGVDYQGASGNCNIDYQGNTVTPYAIFKIAGTQGNYSFETISIVYPE